MSKAIDEMTAEKMKEAVYAGFSKMDKMILETEKGFILFWKRCCSRLCACFLGNITPSITSGGHRPSLKKIADPTRSSVLPGYAASEGED